LPGKVYLPKINPAIREVRMTMIVEPTDTITLFKKYRTKGAAFSNRG